VPLKLSLVLCSALAIFAPAAAFAASVPKAICLRWTSDGDANDTVTMDFVLKAQGSLKTLDQGDGPVKLRFYSIHGMAGLGMLPGTYFPVISGTATASSRFPLLLNAGLLYVTDEGTYTFRVQLDGTVPGGPMRRIASDGTITEGSFTPIDCRTVTIDD
jgi:hypothetical protein